MRTMVSTEGNDPGGSAGLQTRWAAPCAAGWVRLHSPPPKHARTTMIAAGFEFRMTCNYLVDEQVGAWKPTAAPRWGITSLGVHLAGEVTCAAPRRPAPR